MNHHAELTCPAEILGWIAWYPDGGLSEAQRGAVEAHAAICEACRREIEVVAGLAEPTDTARDSERLFARVLARIESESLAAEPRGEEERRPAVATALGRRRAPRLHARRSAGGPTASGSVWAAGIAVALFFAGLWLVHTLQVARATPLYHAASEPGAATAPASGVAVDVVFRNDASAERINIELRGLGARIVSGPTQLGRYRIELPKDADPEAAATLLRAEGTGVASFAEPVHP